MRRQQIQPYLFVIGIAFALSSCFNEPNYSNVPDIKFKGIFRYPLAAGAGVGKTKRDSVVTTVSFTDGNGDLGNAFPLSNADTTLYKSNGGWGNYEIKIFRLENKEYKEVILPIANFLVFPDLTKGKPKGAIEGTLDFTQIFFYGTTVKLFPTKFRIRIRDRALNVSNVIETDTLTLPYLK